MMGHKICLFGEIWKIISKLYLLLLLIWSSVENELDLRKSHFFIICISVNISKFERSMAHTCTSDFLKQIVILKSFNSVLYNYAIDLPVHELVCSEVMPLCTACMSP